MKIPNIVLVEDDNMLQTVFNMFIDDIGYNLLETFTSPKKVIEFCKTKKPDIILMDITFPGEISGIEASKILNSQHNIPIIYISSNTDEEIINEALKTNPYGYLVKPIDKLKLKITIDIALSKCNENKVKQNLNNIINNINTSIFSLNSNYEVEFLNKKSTELFNLDITHIKNKNINEVLPEINFSQNILPILIKNNNANAEFKFNNKNLEILCHKITDNLGDTENIICSINEKIALKNNDESDLKLKSLFDASIEAIILVDKNLKVRDFNQLTVKYLSSYFSKDIKQNSNILEVLSFINNNDLANLINNTLDGVSHYLERIVTVNNINKYFKITIYPITSKQNEINFFYITLYEITKLKETEEKYKNIKSELKPLFESSIQRFYLCDLNYKIVSFNKAAQIIIYNEFNHHLKNNDNVLDFVPTEIGRDNFKKRFDDAKKGEHILFKEKIAFKGTEYWNETHLDPILNDQGEIYRVLLWTLDITESEKNIQALKQSQERYELVASGGNDGIWDWNMINNKIYLSPRWKEILKYDKNDKLEGYGIHDELTHPDDLEYSRNSLNDYLDGKTKDYYVEIRLRRKDKKYIWIAERGSVLRDKEGKPYRMAGSISDITDRKEKEKELNQINKTLLEERNMFLKGEIIITRIEATEDAYFSFISDNVKQLLGYEKSDFLDKKISFFDIIHPDDKNKIEEIRLNKFYNKKDDVEFPYFRIIAKNKEIVWVKNYAIIIKDKDNTPIEFFGYFINISDRISAEEESAKNKIKFEKLFTEASDAILIIKNNKITDYNNKAVELFNYNKKEFLEINIEELSNQIQEKNIDFNEILNKALKGGKQTFYWKFKRKDNSTFDAEVSLSSINLKDETFLQAIIRDITLRKSIEKSLKESEEKLLGIYEAIPDLIFIIDINGDYLDYKPDSQGILEVPKEEILGKNLIDFFGKEKTEEILKKIKYTIEKSKTSIYQYSLDSNIGKRKFESRITKINETSVLSIVRDITDEIKTEII